MQAAIGSKPLDVRRDEDLGAYLTNIITQREEQIRAKELELKQAGQRESDLKEMVKKYEQLSVAVDRSKDPAFAKNPLCSSDDFKPANAAAETTPMDIRRGYEDGTSRFVRELRER